MLGEGRDLHRVILQSWLCVVGARKVVYLSGPITTGFRLLEAVRTGGAIAGAIDSNLTDLAAAAERLRSTTGSIVLDPSPLAVDDWSQADYMLLWTELIGRHASEVRFMPGWQYSLGCVGEFIHAVRIGVATKDLEGVAIPEGEGRSLVTASISDMDGLADRSARVRALRDGLAATMAEIVARPVGTRITA